MEWADGWKIDWALRQYSRLLPLIKAIANNVIVMRLREFTRRRAGLPVLEEMIANGPIFVFRSFLGFERSTISCCIMSMASAGVTRTVSDRYTIHQFHCPFFCLSIVVVVIIARKLMTWFWSVYSFCFPTLPARQPHDVSQWMWRWTLTSRQPRTNMQ